MPAKLRPEQTDRATGGECIYTVVVPGSVARTNARRSSWAVSYRTPELKGGHPG